MRRFVLTLVFAVLAAAGTDVRAAKRNSVAIVIDSATYAAVTPAVRAYASAIEKYDGKPVRLMVAGAAWTPDRIRDSLYALHRSASLEGAVLVGDIPVPMIRRAHHLATAFKMNPSWKWNRSSIPSDRYYDDFGLAFTFLKQEGNLFYYDLSPEGSQKVSCDIYTARIKPAKTDPQHSFTELVALFLERAAAAKAEPEKLDEAFHFGGHGNSSESINARIDEDRAMYEQFGPDVRVRYLNFDEDRFVRARLKAVLADPSLDYAHLHTHGGVGAQYLSKEPYTFMPSEHLRNFKAFLRSKMRSAKDREKVQASLMKDYGVPQAWLDEWEDPVLAAEDSLRSARVDLVLSDLDGYAPAVRLLILDACFNGAFLHDDYVAARYAFGAESRCLAVFGNSVNIIQDHWKNELAGLLGCGVCVGNWARQNLTLESHLFGDPTMRFAARPDAPAGLDYLVTRYGDKAVLRRLSRSSIPDVAGYAMKYGVPVEAGKSLNLRMERLMYIVRNETDPQELTDAIAAGLDDSYELVRRMAARYAEGCGAPQLLEPIAAHYLDPGESTRVRYHLFAALGLYPFAEVEKALRASWSGIWPEQEDFEALLTRLRRSAEGDAAEFAALSDASASVKERGSTVSAQRNACKPGAIAPMLALVADESADEGLRCKAAEALGWYVYSWYKQEIYDKLQAMNISDAAVADEVHRTLRRLEDIANIR